MTDEKPNEKVHTAFPGFKNHSEQFKAIPAECGSKTEKHTLARIIWFPMDVPKTPLRLRHAKTLITGKPGVGKTTLVQKIIKQIGSVNMAGFFTAEIRGMGSRLGFELQGLNGVRRILSHVQIKSRHRVGRYGVDTNGFEEFLAALDLLNPDVELIVIDEIGKMELFSKQFQIFVSDILNSDKQVLATIPLKGNAFIRKIKQRSDIHLLEVTFSNRNLLVEAILDGLHA